MISVDEAKRLAKKNLSPKRYEHTCNVRKLAYSTFTLMQVLPDWQVYLAQYDNPQAILLREGKSLDYPVEHLTVGDKDKKKAALAALLHDIAKELPRDRLLQIFTENAIIAGNAAQRPAPVWHGAAAAILAQTQYGVDDGEILSAIRCHRKDRHDEAG